MGHTSVVGVGASAGGLEACSRLLRALPPATDLAFVVVQHLDPTHPSELAALLGRATTMPVRQASDGQAVDPGHVLAMALDGFSGGATEGLNCGLKLVVAKP
jgi:two-component system CheB/CheR fusion protein